MYDQLRVEEKAGATKPKRKGFISEELVVTTVRDVQDAVATKLSGSRISNDPNFVFGAENIWVFEEEGGELKRVRGDENVESDTKYFALEVFEDTVPCDLFCNVALDQMIPATLCLPDRRRFTRVSPLIIAAMTDEEDVYPWHALSSDGELQVNGISVFCKDTTVPFCEDDSLPISSEQWNPFITVQQKMGVSYELSLDKYEQLVNHKEGSTERRDSHFGVLQTVLSHKETQGVLWYPKGKIKNVNPEYLAMTKKQKSGRPSQQSVFYSFMLRKGTKLEPHGIAVVFDNLGEFENHCTLVLKTDVQDETTDFPMIYGSVGVQMPPAGATDEDLTNIMSPKTDKSQPEFFDTAILSKYVRSFPYLAAEFELHHFEIKGQAEPLPLDTFEEEDDNDDAQDIYRAVSILFSQTHCSEHDVYHAMEMMEAAEYRVDHIDGSFRKTLLDAMDRIDMLSLPPESRELLVIGIDILSQCEEMS